MANLIEYIQSQVYENSTEDISGSIMQQVLTRMASDEGVVNVHTITGQTPFADYNNAQAARDAVPAGFKKLGLIITYKLSSGWYVDEFIGSATSGWSTASNWKCLGPISVSQNASTGKTTITIGSQSFDVATQPVSVSQNTSTGGLDLSIGSNTYNMAKQEEVNNLKLWSQDSTINRFIKELYVIGDIEDIDGNLYLQVQKGASEHGVIVAKGETATNVTILASFYTTGENWNTEILTLPEFNHSGVSALIVVDWSAVNSSVSYREINKNIVLEPKFSPYIASQAIKTLVDTNASNISKLQKSAINYEKFRNEVLRLNPEFYEDSSAFSIVGCIRLADGTVNSVSGYHCTDYIKIDKTKNIYCIGLSDNQYVAFAYFYNINKQQISGSAISNIGVVTGELCIITSDNIPSNAQYVRVSTQDTILSSSLCCQLKSISDEIELLKQTTENQNILIDSLFVGTINLVGTDAYPYQGYIKPADGTVYDEAHTTYYHSDYLEINVQNDIKIVGLSNNQYVALVYFYNSSKQGISGISNVSTNPEQEYTISANDIPSNAKYIRASIEGSRRTGGYIKQRGLSPATEIEELKESLKLGLNLTIPNVIYAIVGTELNIWNDTVTLSLDKGLHSPLNYQVRWACNKGLITERCFRYTPIASDAGTNVTCTCYLYDTKGNFVESKTFTIKVLAKNALSIAKNIAYFGDSLGWQSAQNLYQDLHNSDKFTGTIPTMVGTRGETYKYDAVGGYGWANYATAGQTAYRASVTGVSSIGRGAIYSDGSHNFEVIEVNIVEGSGNILLLPHYTSSGALIMPSGTLTKISGTGDNTIPYTDAFAESGNPLWNESESKLDVSQYKQLCGLQSTDKIDAVSFQFGINDANLADNLPQLLQYIQALYTAFVTDNENCKIIVGLTTSAGNTLDGNGANYGASDNWKVYLDRVYRIRKFYLTLQGNSDMPNLRIGPTHLEVDRYYGYGFSERQISQRTTATEKYHNNYVHPGTDGYGQIGDAYFATFIGVLTES